MMRTSTINKESNKLRLIIVKAQLIKSILLIPAMSLHWQNLSFDLHTTQKNNRHSPQLQDVIKSSIDHQIHQHVRATPSLEHTLIARTKKILSNRYVSPACIAREESEHKEETNRSNLMMGKSRREWRVNQTKKQLQLLNQLYRNINKNKVKQYCEQIELKQAEIHMTLTHNNFRKTINYSNQKPVKHIKSRQIKTSQVSPQRLHTRTKSPKQKDLDVLFDRLKPYRRLQFVRNKAKDLVEPWEVNN